MPLGDTAERRWGSPSLVVLRADLQRAMLDTVARRPGITVQTGTEVVGVASHATGVAAATRRGLVRMRAEGAILVGADGLRSTIRESFAPGPPRFSGRTAWRALIDADAAPAFARRPETALWLGRRAHVVHYPVAGGALINIVAIAEDAWRGDDVSDFWNQDGALPSAPFARWHRDARALLASAPDWRRWPLFDRDPLATWGEGRVTLLGDAAHPALPFLAQGAGLAIEDAAMLGAQLRPGIDPERGLKAYEQARLARTRDVQLASRRQGRIYHLGGPAAVARDWTLRALGPQRMLAQLDWLYQYRIDAS